MFFVQGAIYSKFNKSIFSRKFKKYFLKRDFDLHKQRLANIDKKPSILKRYLESKPIEIRHNVKTLAIKANEDYARLQKNIVIHERLNILKPSKNKKSMSKNRQTEISGHVNGYLVNRKKEAKRIDEENQKFHKRIKNLSEKFVFLILFYFLFFRGSIFSLDKYKKHLERYEKTLILRTKNNSSPSTMKIIVQKNPNREYQTQPNLETTQKFKTNKFNHFNIKLKDYSTLMLTAKDLNDKKTLYTTK